MIETMTSTAVAAQGDAKGIKEHCKELNKLAKQGFKIRGDDAAAFRAVLGAKGGL